MLRPLRCGECRPSAPLAVPPQAHLGLGGNSSSKNFLTFLGVPLRFQKAQAWKRFWSLQTFRTFKVEGFDSYSTDGMMAVGAWVEVG